MVIICYYGFWVRFSFNESIDRTTNDVQILTKRGTRYEMERNGTGLKGNIKPDTLGALDEEKVAKGMQKYPEMYRRQSPITWETAQMGLPNPPSLAPQSSHCPRCGSARHSVDARRCRRRCPTWTCTRRSQAAQTSLANVNVRSNFRVWPGGLELEIEQHITA